MKEIKGNLLTELEEGRIDVAIHCCNCRRNFGSGIALSIKNKWPNAYQADLDYEDLAANRLGNTTYAEVADGRYVINLYGQLNYGGGRNLDYEAFYNGLEKARDLCSEKNLKRIGFPKLIGCFRAGGNWRIVETMIDEVFKDWDVTIVDFNE